MSDRQQQGLAADGLAREFSVRLRPRFEGCNVGTWIGFKHVMYLCEEAVVAYFRAQALGPSHLLANCGLSLEIVDMRLRLKEGIRVDDEIEALLALTDAAEGGRILFKVQLLRWSEREGEKSVVASGKAAAILCELHENFGVDVAVPAALKGAVHRSLEAAAGSHEAPVLIPPELAGAEIGRALQPPDKSSFVWKWRIPYFYCHDTYRLQHSGFVRIMEEVVDLFLQDKGISIRTMLDTRNWIPVVTDARVRLLADAKLEEEVYTLYEVEEVIKDMIYTAAMRCFVRRGDRLVPVAEGRISHAYVHITEREVGTRIATFDADVLAALGA
jgi:acyl-CoA thioesterase FadM